MVYFFKCIVCILKDMGLFCLFCLISDHVYNCDDILGKQVDKLNNAFELCKLCCL